MPPATDWRSPRAYDELNRLDRAGFAWEFLRRNADYQRDYARTVRRIASGVVDEETALAQLGSQWGLIFRLQSEASPESRATAVAAGARTGRRHPRRCA